MLAEWGDTEALDALKRRLATEDDPWARLTGTNALARSDAEFEGEVPQELADSVAWSTEHTEFDGVARRRGRQVGD
jgi:hypothetical protein